MGINPLCKAWLKVVLPQLYSTILQLSTLLKCNYFLGLIVVFFFLIWYSSALDFTHTETNNVDFNLCFSQALLSSKYPLTFSTIVN